MSTVFVTLSDSNPYYYNRAKQTIREVRNVGKWSGDIVLVAVDFEPETIPGVEIHRVPHIDLDALRQSHATNPLYHAYDDRWFTKLFQWDKLQVFTDFFRRWDRVVFLDAGMRVTGPVQPLLDLEWRGLILGPNDGDHNDAGTKTFRCQLDTVSNPDAFQSLLKEFPETILDESNYILNCMFLYDTALLDQISYSELVDTMLKYPIASSNEMTIMNLVFHFRHNVWKPLPVYANSGRYLFGWNETNYKDKKVQWNDFHFIKYSFTAPSNIGSPSKVLQEKYIDLCNYSSDIYEHLPTLASYASMCSHVTECGVRGAVSSYAFATALLNNPNGKLVQVDPCTSIQRETFHKECDQQGLEVVYYSQSDLDCPMEPTDLLFIDTWHVYGQLKRELARWHTGVRKFIILHDVEVDKWRGETLRCGGDILTLSRQFGVPVDEIRRGLWPALLEFLSDHPEWVLQRHDTNCNGLAVLSRVPVRV